MSLYTSNLTPLRSALAVAGVSSSIFFLGNVTNAYFGVVPAIQNIALSKKQKAESWLYFYDRAKPVFLGSAVTSTAAFALAAYLLTTTRARAFAIAGAVTSGIIGPFTVIQMLPVNDAITAVANGDTDKEPYVDALVEKWRRAHLVRLLLGGIAYASSLAIAFDFSI